MKKVFLFALLVLNFSATAQKFNPYNDEVMATHIAMRELWRFTYIDMWEYTKPQNKVYECETNTLIRGGLDMSGCFSAYTVTLVINKNLTYIITFSYKDNTKCRVIISKVEGGVDYDVIDQERNVNFVENNDNKRLHAVTHAKDVSLFTDDFMPLTLFIWIDDIKYMYCFSSTKFSDCKK